MKKRPTIAVAACLLFFEWAAAFTLQPCWSTYTADVLPIYSGFAANGSIADFAALSGGTLKLNTIGKDAYGWYTLDCQQGLDFEKGVTVQFRAKLLSSEGGGTAGVIVYDRSSRYALIELLPNLLNVSSVGNAAVNTSVYHTYHIRIKNGTNNLNVYLDSAPNPILTGTIPAAVLTDSNSISFGDFTATADSDWEISHLSWTALGSFAPGDSGLVGDYDYNCIVDIQDFFIFALNWLGSDPDVDLTGQSIVNQEDFHEFSSSYLQKQDNSAVYITDIPLSLPAESLSVTNSSSKWMVMAYETAQLKGRMSGSFSFNVPGDMVIPLPVSGWHKVYIGYWNPDYAYDGACSLRYKLSGDPAFSEIHGMATIDTQDATYIHEVFAVDADLTGQNLVIGKSSGLLAQKMFVAYIKLVPLTQQQTSSILSDRSQSGTRNAVAVIDTRDLFKTTHISSSEDIKKIVEPYRYSDIKTVLLTVGYGDRLIYDSDVNEAVWAAGTPRSTALVDINSIGHDTVVGQKQMAMSLRSLDENNSPFEQTIALAAHSIGLDFEILFNMAIQGGLPAWSDYDPNGFVNKNPAYWQVRADGKKVPKASYAFTQVQSFFVSLLEEAVVRTNTDGVCLSFNKGPHFIQQQDPPFVTAFRAKYGINPRPLPASDERLGIVRCEFMTSLMTQVRQELDRLEIQTGRQLPLSIWVWGYSDTHANGLAPKQEGIDVQTWLESGLVDAVYCATVDSNYLAWCQNYSREFVLALPPDAITSSPPASVIQAYGQGVDVFAYDSIQKSQVFPDKWAWMRRIGHVEEIEDWGDRMSGIDSVRINNVNGVDVLQGLADAVYSGG